MAKQIAVIGLGRFGHSLAVTLSRLNVEVLAADIDEDRVKAISTKSLPLCRPTPPICLSSGTRYAQLDVVAVGMSGFEASLMTTLHLKELGVKKSSREGSVMSTARS